MWNGGWYTAKSTRDWSLKKAMMFCTLSSGIYTIPGSVSVAGRKSKSKQSNVSIIKIDFILDLEIWVILQQSDQEAAGCNHVSERERDKGDGKDNTTTKNLQIGIYMFGVILHQQWNPINFLKSFLCSMVCVATNKSKLQKFWEVQNLQGLSNIAKIEWTLVIL